MIIICTDESSLVSLLLCSSRSQLVWTLRPAPAIHTRADSSASGLSQAQTEDEPWGTGGPARIHQHNPTDEQLDTRPDEPSRRTA